MNKTIAMLLFAAVLFLGLPSIAMAHEGHQHPIASTQNSETVASKEGKTAEALKLKVAAVKKDKLSDECPCGKSCTKCACFSHTCCKVMNQFTAAHNIIAERKNYTLSAFSSLSGIHPESLTKPPQAV